MRRYVRLAWWSRLGACLGATLLVACSGSDAAAPRATPDADSGLDSGRPSPKTETGKVGVNGASRYYEARGSGDAVMLIHGFTLDTRMWDDQFDALSTKYKVVRFD